MWLLAQQQTFVAIISHVHTHARTHARTHGHEHTQTHTRTHTLSTQHTHSICSWRQNTWHVQLLSTQHKITVGSCRHNRWDYYVGTIATDPLPKNNNNNNSTQNNINKNKKQKTTNNKETKNNSNKKQKQKKLLNWTIRLAKVQGGPLSLGRAGRTDPAAPANQSTLHCLSQLAPKRGPANLQAASAIMTVIKTLSAVSLSG